MMLQLYNHTLGVNVANGKKIKISANLLNVSNEFLIADLLSLFVRHMENCAENNA
jgi:hypothetical protein